MKTSLMNNKHISSLIKAILLSCFLIIFAASTAWANYVTISNMTYTPGFINFDISWDNSWRNTGTPGSTQNYDGVWVFVKFRHACADDSLNPSSFRHVWLDTDPAQHTVPAGASLEVGTTTIVATPRGMGVFIYRDSDGLGTFSLQNISLKWDTLAQGVTSTDWDVRLYAFEMVYVPQASFWVGDGVSSYTFKNGSTSNPLLISSENALPMGTAVGSLNQQSVNLSGSLPLNYPKGFGAFWVMKYEITQEQYVSFLNSLNRTQQNIVTYTSLPPGSITTANTYVMAYSGGSSSLQYRNGIRCPSSFHPTKPITFFCDLNGNNVPNEADDGQHIALNYMWDYPMYIIDWAALRPMSEMEFEKVNRGPDYAYGGIIAYETPWSLNGSVTANRTQVAGVSNSGMINEVPSNSGIGLIHGGNASPHGPRRVGSTYSATTDRIYSGSSYYGAADMGGNLWEYVIRVTNSSGFTRTTYGDGLFNSTSPYFPSAWEVGYYRGGDYAKSYDTYATSYRHACYNNWNSAFGGDFFYLGVRGAR